MPLIVRYPAEFGPRRVEELVSLVDLAPTLLDFAGAGPEPDTPAPLDGRSLRALMHGRDESWPNEVFSEYTGEGVVAPCRMLRRCGYKYIYTHGHPGMMFDTGADPLERENLCGRPDLAELERSMLARLLDDWYPDAVAATCIQSQKERLFIQESTQGDPNWAFRFRQDDGARFVRNASAVGTKIRARYPFVEPTPFER